MKMRIQVKENRSYGAGQSAPRQGFLACITLCCPFHLPTSLESKRQSKPAWVTGFKNVLDLLSQVENRKPEWPHIFNWWLFGLGFLLNTVLSLGNLAV